MTDLPVTRSKETLGMINDLLNKGVEKISVIMRHSARHYHQTVQMEPFMGLTDIGKDFAMEFGETLPHEPGPIFFSSHFGRCIETAYLMDKGYTKKHCRFNGHNTLSLELAPFYIKDMNKAFTAFDEMGNDTFLRAWFNKELPGEMMQDSEETANVLTEFLTDRLKQLEPGQIALCVSHDWNLYPLREHKLGLPFEAHGKVEFLESVVVFELGGKNFIMNHQRGPIEI
ncbi:MAG: histidine phosphatase family protein [Desulfobacteraceae bacterium]|nr:histidine phosphatase family protein [Desulfobacteraceae bacterium]